MKLLELVGVKKFYDKELSTILKSLGDDYEESGNGSFSVTLKSTSKPEVIKFWVNDSSYDDFIKYVIAHPSKHLPKLYSKPKEISAFFTRPEDFPKKIKYIRMEKLNPIENIKHADDINEIFKHLRMLSSHKMVDAYYDKLTSEPNILLALKELHVDDVMSFLHDMFNMLYVILHGDHDLDVHDENIMLRPNGELVIIDPIYNDNDFHQAIKLKVAIKTMKKEQMITGKSGVKTKEAGTRDEEDYEAA